MSQPSVLIAGAGPTGLAAALFLSERGMHARIVDAAESPARYSRALVVNPRTLDLLEPSGVTAKMRAEGRRVAGVRFHEDGKVLATIEAADLHPCHGLTVLSQERSEALLTGALHERGIDVERGVRATFAGQDDTTVRVALAGSTASEATYDTVLAADGAHSDFRKGLGIDFPGSAYPETWPLFDIPLRTSLDIDHAHILFFPEGMIFALALDENVWRIISSLPDPLERLPTGTTSGEPLWTSAFHIAHRVAERCASGRVALGGDAAHVHSPVGARGMNLGIEDAAAFAMCLAGNAMDPVGALAAYHQQRHPVHRSVVRRVHAITSMARSDNPVVGGARRLLLPAVATMPGICRFILRTVAGLDHPAPHAIPPTM